MTLIRRLLGVICGTAGLIGLLLCIAGIIGCWLGHAEVTRRVDRAFGRAEGAILQGNENLGGVSKRLNETKSELAALRKRESDMASQPPAEKRARRALSKKAVGSLSPQLGEAHQMLVKATEVSLVANGLLEALAELPLSEQAHIDIDRLRSASDQLAELNERTTKLASMLEKVSPDPDPEIGHESSRAGEVLDRILTAIDEGSHRLETARETVARGHSRINLWIDRLAFAITAILGWIGAGQFSLLVHGKKLTFARKRSPGPIPQ